MLKVKDIAKAIEDFAPLSLKEDWDNPGLQVGDREMEVTGVLLCLDVTEEILKEARKLDCNMIVSHHPLIFGGLKRLTGATPTERIVADALRYSIAIYSAHTNLDSAFEGVSYEMAHMLGMKECRPLERNASGNEKEGLGIVGDVSPTPKLEFLRKVRDTFEVKDLRYSAQTPGIMVRKVALCGGSGGSLIRAALKSGADVYITTSPAMAAKSYLPTSATSKASYAAARYSAAPSARPIQTASSTSRSANEAPYA